MKSSIKTIIITVVIVALLGGGYLLYDSLSGKYDAKTPADITDVTDTTDATDIGDTSEATDSTGDTPDFTFYDIDGNRVNLSDFKGKPIVLNFWASWCGPCRSEMPELQTAYEEHGDSVQFLMVDLSGGGNDTREDALSVINENNYTFPVYFDNDNSGARAYSVSSIPSTYFIDAEGNLADYQIGMLMPERLTSAIEKIIN